MLTPEKRKKNKKNEKSRNLLKKHKKNTQLLKNCIGPTIRIGPESWCLPYAGFFFIFQ